MQIISHLERPEILSGKRMPPYLQKGDIIGIVAPGAYCTEGDIGECVACLRDWGYEIRIGSTLAGNSSTYFSATDEERSNDLQGMLDDPEIKCIFCVRAGYGMTRIIDKLDFTGFQLNPKWIVGFSDITVLHCHLNSVYGIASLHSPMASIFTAGTSMSAYRVALKNSLEGHGLVYECAPYRLNRTGMAEAELVGGNLSILSHLAGSVSCIRTQNKILFIEDVGEYLYHIDRMLLQLKRAGLLNGLAGLIVGGFTNCKDTERGFGKSAYEIIHEHINDFAWPVCFGFPVSHDPQNVPLKSGARYNLNISASKVILKESSSDNQNNV